MSKLTWKLQEKFVDKVLKGEYLFWDFSQKEGIYVFGDSFHFYVIPMEDVFIDFIKLENYNGHINNLKEMNLIRGYERMNFDEPVNFTFDIQKRDKNEIRRFESDRCDIWIGMPYLKEIDFDRNLEYFTIGSDPESGYRKPVRFECEDFTAVILPVRIKASDDDAD